VSLTSVPITKWTTGEHEPLTICAQRHIASIDDKARQKRMQHLLHY
jgi:hypothetical protein